MDTKFNCPHCHGPLFVSTEAGRPDPTPPLFGGPTPSEPRESQTLGWALKNHLGAYATIYRNIGMHHDDKRWTMDVSQATLFSSLTEAAEYNSLNRDMLCYPCESVEVKAR